MKLFCVYLVFQWDNIVGKVLPKVGVSTKYKKGGMNSHVEGLSKEGGEGSNLLHTMIPWKVKTGAMPNLVPFLHEMGSWSKRGWISNEYIWQNWALLFVFHISFRCFKTLCD